jgi:hypothetical protein
MAESAHSRLGYLATHLNVRRAIGVLAVAIVAAVGGYLVGANRSGVSIHTGSAHSEQAQISITGEDGWVYNVPLDVNWTDASGAWHQDGRPDCLPPTGEVVGPIKFAATEVTVSGSKVRPVVWVWCTG